jgi:ribosomal protein S18 acetylase RimI-like enzyme
VASTGERNTDGSLPAILVRPALPSDVPTLAACLSRSFLDDPVSSFLFPANRTRQRKLERYFRWQLTHVFLPRGEAWTTEELSGASLWMPQRIHPRGVVEVLTHLAAVLRILGGRLPAALRLLDQLEARRPRAPHCYLATIGTDPALQRTGIGSALMKVVLDELDGERTPCYLESSKEENLAFYLRHGFTVTGEVAAFAGMPGLWLMWREAGGARGR